MVRKLKEDEQWALNLLKPLCNARYRNGYKVSIPESDPPDCTLIPLEPSDKPTNIEFSALGPKKYFEFVAVMLKKKTPFFAELQIPYEPEMWLQEVINRKAFPDDGRYDILCTHFCSHFSLPGFTQKDRHQNNDTNPFKVTDDMLHRFMITAWKNQKKSAQPKPIILVQPGSNPYRLTPTKDPKTARRIDISEGYPTIQMRVTNFPNGQPIKWGELENLSHIFKPYTNDWKVPDKFRKPKPIPEGHCYKIVQRQDNADKLIEEALIMCIDMSMPVLKYV